MDRRCVEETDHTVSSHQLVSCGTHPTVRGRSQKSQHENAPQSYIGNPVSLGIISQSIFMRDFLVIS